MRTTLYINCLLCAGLLCPSITAAGIYSGFSINRLTVDTPAASTNPVAAGLYLGYARQSHQLELVLMDGIDDDSLNQLTVGVDAGYSLFYRYSLSPKRHFKIDLILGASQLAIASAYQSAPGAVSDFSGMSYGIGFKEALWSVPRLSLTFDLMRLYHGEHMDINSISFGLRYDF